MNSSEVLFLGKNNGAVSWYRTGSPAFYLGCDWAGIIGDPDDYDVMTAIKRGGMAKPDLDKYTIIVMQQVWGGKWMNEILRLRDKGIKVLYEIDDFIHGVRKMPGHAAFKVFDAKALAKHEMCMKVCDGIIVSTPFLAKEYRKFNKNIYVCKNAIEGARYKDLDLPTRDSGKLHIGWAGGEGHQEPIKQWIPTLQTVLDEYDVRFVSIGLPLANYLNAEGRTLALPFVPVENVPSVLCNIDIAIAPAGRNKFFKAKSDLRFLEFGALGIPLVADPFVYGESIEDNQTGLLAEDQEQALICMRSLIEDPEVRAEIASNVKSYVHSERAMESQHQQWIDVFLDVMKVEVTA